MKIHAGILLSPATCAAIGPALQDFLASMRVSGLRTPEDVRLELLEVAELGRKFQVAQLQKRAADVRQGVRFVDSERSLVVPLPAMTCSTAEAARKLDIGCRAVQRRAERGTLRATRAPGGELRFDRAEIDRLVKERTRR
jgi:excisionase family DNA binding protein